MKRIAGTMLVVLAGALAVAAGPAQAQAMGYGYFAPQFYVGGGVGASWFENSSGGTAGWLNSDYSSSTTLSAGDYISSYSRQDASSFGAKLYGGAWLTPNVGLEVGYAYLGNIRWWVNSFNTTGSFSVTDTGTVQPTALYEALLLGVNNGGLRFYGKAGAYQAWSDFNASSFNNSNGGSFGASETVHNTGALLGLGVSAPFGWHGAWRLELEDYLNVGQNDTTNIPPWRGNVLQLTAGYTFLF